ncbi:glycosyltransferase [Mongoliimonas terrestris]|uniref:glycosyltransferase n=1 Tax=Mongoliimonas terrestris TaxID=1709001 RepID=UPI00111547FB|nr:glycosyltransferase [Mongoliimonas terrestris]
MADDRFAVLLDDAEARLKRRDRLGAAVRVRMAANAATTRHPGLFQSPRAEAVLGAVSAWLVQRQNPVRKAPGPLGRKPSILHVVTEAYRIGGHTKALQRWVDADVDHVHHVAMTHQLTPVPDALAASVAASGGRLSVLSGSSSLFGMARQLRALASDALLVVLHIHPHDVVPSLAFAGWTERPPIAFFNHADHVFWLGEAISDAVINFRESGSRLCRARRGFAAERDVLLPLPLPAEAPAPTMTKAQARERLGLPASARITLTVASAGKLKPNAHACFFTLHRPLFDADPDVHMLLVGPAADDPVLADRLRPFGGRMRALGVQVDLAPYMAAADLYVDSTPFASQTSMLEAAMRRLPVLSWRPYPVASLSAVMGSDDVALSTEDITFNDPDAYRAAVLRLLRNETAATALGARLAAAIPAHHAGEGWRRALADAYDRTIANAAHRPHTRIEPEPPSAVDEVVLAFHEGAGYSNDLLDFDNFEFMPLSMQLAEVGAIYRRHPEILKRFLPLSLRLRLSRLRPPA